jgi:hypothetical protein
MSQHFNSICIIAAHRMYLLSFVTLLALVHLLVTASDGLGKNVDKKSYKRLSKFKIIIFKRVPFTGA